MPVITRVKAKALEFDTDDDDRCEDLHEAQAFIPALSWVSAIEKKIGEALSSDQIRERYPKFAIGYFVTFLVMLLLAIQAPGLLGAAKVSTGESNVFRVLFFVMTFFTIGLVSNYKGLWKEGIGKLALVYVVCLFGFIIWIGLVISWIFFDRIMPPTA